MKSVIMLGLVFAGLAQTIPAHALVRLVERCNTSDGKYEIAIADNQGIGPNRESHLTALIKDEQGDVVGEYAVYYKSDRIHSISFGHADYVDSETDGKDFDFAFPSTNTPISVIATLHNGAKIAYGLRFDYQGVNQGSLNCSVN